MRDEIQAELMTPESFTGFGSVLIPKEAMITFKNEKVSHYNELVGFKDMGPEPVVSFFRAKRREFSIDNLERHVNSCEIFFPLRGTGLMAFTHSMQNGEPDLNTLRVFFCSPDQPFTAAKGVWHLFPFPVGESFESFVIVEKELIEKDLEFRQLANPIRIVL